MRTPESVLKKELKRLLNERGAFWSMVTGGGYSKPGDPDMVVCYRGRYIGVEAKTWEGRLSDIQKVRRDEIIAAGGVHVTARCVEDVSDALDAIDREVDDVQEERSEEMDVPEEGRGRAEAVHHREDGDGALHDSGRHRGGHAHR